MTMCVTWGIRIGAGKLGKTSPVSWLNKRDGFSWWEVLIVDEEEGEGILLLLASAWVGVEVLVWILKLLVLGYWLRVAWTPMAALANISHLSYYALHQHVMFRIITGSTISDKMYIIYSLILAILFIGVLFKAFINLVNFCVLQSFFTYGNLLKNDPTEIEPLSTSKPASFYSMFSKHYNTFQNSPFTPKISNGVNLVLFVLFVWLP